MDHLVRGLLVTLAVLCTINHTLTAPLTAEEKQLRELKSGMKVAWKVLVSIVHLQCTMTYSVISSRFTEH